MIRKANPVDALTPGDLRSTGKVATVLGWIEQHPALIDKIVAVLPTANPALNMRLMDILEKYARRNPQHFERHVEFVLNRLGLSPQKEMRWHVAQILRHVRLSPTQTGRAVALMRSYLSDNSRIVQAEAAQTYYRLASGSPAAQARARRHLEAHATNAAPALKARVRRILKG